MKHAGLSPLFNEELTPNNAIRKGYEYVDDILLDRRKNISKEFLEIFAENSMQLGLSKRKANICYGLYIPIK